MAIRVAFGSVPKDGGTFTFYRNQRAALATKGIELICVSIGAQEAFLWNDDFADDGCVLLAKRTTNIKKQAQAFVAFCEKERIDIVIAVNSFAMLSAIPHLPERIRLMARCANAFDHGYKITMAGRERLSRIVALTPRLRKDLVEDYNADESIIELVPNGIDPDIFKMTSQAERGEQPALQIGFVGRLEHNQKGVLHISHIVKALNKRHVNFTLDIVGKGKHAEQMMREMESEINNGQVNFLGAMGPKEIPAFHASKDIYLFTSHFEGCPNALLEAMMAGCVPVSWLIEGITDFVIDDGATGYISKTGDYDGIASQIEHLHKNRSLLKDMSTKVRAEAVARFSTEVCSTEYSRIFNQVMATEPPTYKIKSWSDFVPDPNFPKGKLDWLPPSIKHRIKSIIKSS